MGKHCRVFEYARYTIMIGALGALACETVEDPSQPTMEFRSGGSGLEIEANGSDVFLTWNAQPGSTYTVYRSTDPGFAIGDSGVAQFDLGAVGGFSDTFLLDRDDPQDPNDSFHVGVFYQVVEHTAEGADQPMQKVGRVSVGLVPSRAIPLVGIQDRYSKIPLCLGPLPEDQTLQQLFDKDPVVAGIHWWDAPTQGWASPIGFYDVLEMRLGNVITVQGEIDNWPAIFSDHFELTGWVPPTSPPVCGPWATSLYEGTNAVTWPVLSGSTTADDLLQIVPGAVAIGRWDVVDQEFRWYPDVPSGAPPAAPSVAAGDFDVHPCRAIYVHIDSGDGDPPGPLVEGTWWPPYCAP